MIEEFGLTTKPLAHLAKIVRGADTGRLDLTQLDAAMGLYDAFYRWTRDAVDETHD